VKSIAKLCLCALLLLVSVNTVLGNESDQKQGFKSFASLDTTCIAESHSSLQTVSVIFTHGKVFDQHGHLIESGSVLTSDSLVHVSGNGFLSFSMADGTTVNVQPNTSISIACALLKDPINFDINQPFTVGAIRG